MDGKRYEGRKLEIEIEFNKTVIKAQMIMQKQIETTLSDFSQAKSRIQSQLKKIRTSKENKQMYDDVVYAQLDENYAIAKPKDIKPLNYIPHHLVLKKIKSQDQCLLTTRRVNVENH